MSLDSTHLEAQKHLIYRYLLPEDLIRLCKTNKTLLTLCGNSEVWKYFLKRDFHMETNLLDVRKLIHLYVGEMLKEIAKEANATANMLSIKIYNIKIIGDPDPENNLDLYEHSRRYAYEEALGSLGLPIVHAPSGKVDTINIFGHIISGTIAVGIQNTIDDLQDEGSVF